MNLEKVREQLLKLGEKVALTVDEETSDKLVLHTELVAKSYFKDTVYFRIVVFKRDTLHVFFTFDEIEKTYDNLFLINKFNSDNPWFRAYIVNLNDKDFLELHYVTFSLETEKQVTDTIGYLLNDLLSETTLKYLNPILNNKK